MKRRMRIKIKTFGNQVMPEIIDKGDFIDLRANKTIRMNKSDFKVIPLGVAMQLPDGFEAIVVSRSSTYKNYKIFNPGALGVIDGSYSGNEDEWKYPAYALKDTVVKEGDRICQFRIQLSQKASFWQKLKWLFSNKITLVKTDTLSSVNRGGLGSTGHK